MSWEVRQEHQSDVSKLYGQAPTVSISERCDKSRLRLHTNRVKTVLRIRNYSYLQLILLIAGSAALIQSPAMMIPAGSQQLIATAPPPAFFMEIAQPSTSKRLACLPKDVRADEIVSYGSRGKSDTTVETTLVQMKARCRNGKLVDRKYREIRFFRPSCWGNPPEDYLEIRQREDEELAKLRRHYTVIVFGCNPMIQ